MAPLICAARSGKRRSHLLCVRLTVRQLNPTAGVSVSTQCMPSKRMPHAQSRSFETHQIDLCAERVCYGGNIGFLLPGREGAGVMRESGQCGTE